MRNSDENGIDRLNDLYHKVISLTEYAKKYDHAFDAKVKVDEMRITVNGLIHQFGVR